MKKVCFFIGHREGNDALLLALDDEIERHITEYGVTEFVVGHYGGFDSTVTACLILAKHRHPEVTMTVLEPYLNRQAELPRLFDGRLFPEVLETTPRRYAIVKANQYMIDHADYLIAYLRHPASNTRNLVEYAQRRQQKGQLKITWL